MDNQKQPKELINKKKKETLWDKVTTALLLILFSAPLWLIVYIVLQYALKR